MSDGNTAVSISPVPSEDEMVGIRHIFERAANAIVQASELSKQVAELQTKFDTMARDLNLVRDRNAALETTLADVRAQRDTAMGARDNERALVRELRAELSNTQSESNHYHEQLKDTLAKLEAMTKDRDEAMQAWHGADLEASEAKAKLTKIQHALGIVDQPKPEPVVEAKPEPQPEPTPTHTSPSISLPEPTSDERHDPWPSPSTPTEPWKHD